MSLIKFSWCDHINVIFPQSVFQDRSCKLYKKVDVPVSEFFYLPCARKAKIEQKIQTNQILPLFYINNQTNLYFLQSINKVSLFDFLTRLNRHHNANHFFQLYRCSKIKMTYYLSWFFLHIWYLPRKSWSSRAVMLVPRFSSHAKIETYRHPNSWCLAQYRNDDKKSKCGVEYY